MSDNATTLSRQIESAADLQSVVRTMKAIAAANIGQYERSVQALADYERSVELGLGACLRKVGPTESGSRITTSPVIGAVVFGSDQGLVGRFNDVVTDHAITTLERLPGTLRVWAVGERLHERLMDAGLSPLGPFTVPGSVSAIAPLIGQILLDSRDGGALDADSTLLLFHNSPAAGATYTSVNQRLLPLDEAWRRTRIARQWPTNQLPEVMGDTTSTLAALIREYLFVLLFQACAQSLASENASRLAAMERADQNIDRLLEELRGSFHRVRQNRIDEELFDVITSFEAMTNPLDQA